MKQLLKKSLVLVVMFTTIVSYSNSFAFITVEKTKNITTVSIDNVNEGSLFSIKDCDDVILYSEQIKETGSYSKNFDLTNLPDANYYFELEKMNEIKIIPFTVKANIAEFVKTEEYSIIKPEIIVKNDRVYISQISVDNRTWEIEVYYEGSDLAYNEKLKDVQNFNRTYDFSSSEKGNYTVTLSSEGRTFKNEIQIP